MKKFGEQDLTYPILYILDKYGSLDTGTLIDLVRTEYTFTGDNRDPLLNRPGDEKINQIIRNIVSHRKSKNNIIYKGWVTYNSGILSITPQGVKQLKDHLI